MELAAQRVVTTKTKSTLPVTTVTRACGWSRRWLEMGPNNPTAGNLNIPAMCKGPESTPTRASTSSNSATVSVTLS